MQFVPHRSEQPYLMAGFPVKLQNRSNTLPEITRTRTLLPFSSVTTPAALLPPQPSLVYEPEPDRGKSSGAAEERSQGVFLTSVEHPIYMDEITVRKCESFRSPCSLLGKEAVVSLSRDFRAVSLKGDPLPYSLAEELVPNAPDPSLALQVYDLDKDGRVSISEFVVVTCLARHYFGSHVDFSRLDKKLAALQRRYEELESPTISTTIQSISKLLVDPQVLDSLLTAINCIPHEAITFTEYLCVAKFWEEIEQSILEEDPPNQKDICEYVTSCVGGTDSSFSFEEILSSTDLL